MHFLLICNPENRRVSTFVAELEALKAHSYTLLAYQDLLDGTLNLEAHIRPNTIVKIESPGENSIVRQALVEYGATMPHSINPAFLADFGRIVYQDEWYQGFCRFLSSLKPLLLGPDVHLMNGVDSILTLFDKVATKAILAKNNIPTPPMLGNAHDYKTLKNQMQTRRIHSVFIKPAHGSSASGVVAFRTNGERVQAISSIEVVKEDGAIALYNSLKVRTYEDEETIEALLNHLLQGKTCIEQWVPKATFKGRSFDFRVVVIAGKARHIVARTSKSPITNLHLGNSRGDLSAIVAYLGVARFEAVKKIAEQSAAYFPDCLYMGIDVLISNNLKHIMVLELNAFGDLLPNLRDAGETIYEAQIKASVQKWQNKAWG